MGVYTGVRAGVEAGARGRRGESSRERRVWAAPTHRLAQLAINCRHQQVVPQAAMSCPGAAVAVLPPAGPSLLLLALIDGWGLGSMEGDGKHRPRVSRREVREARACG